MRGLHGFSWRGGGVFIGVGVKLYGNGIPIHFCMYIFFSSILLEGVIAGAGGGGGVHSELFQAKFNALLSVVQVQLSRSARAYCGRT